MTNIRIDLDDIIYDEYLKIQIWCKNNLLDFRSDYLDWGSHLDTWWMFDHERDAALFAMRWL